MGTHEHSENHSHLIIFRAFLLFTVVADADAVVVVTVVISNFFLVGQRNCFCSLQRCIAVSDVATLQLRKTGFQKQQQQQQREREHCIEGKPAHKNQVDDDKEEEEE